MSTEQLLIAVVGVVGTLAGVIAQGLVSAFGKAQDRRMELLLDTYQAFIDATAEVAAEARSGQPRTAAVWAKLIGAKQKILYFAPAEVVAALAAFDRSSQVLGNPDADFAFAALLRSMRLSLSATPIPDSDLYRVMVGKDTFDDDSKEVKPKGSSEAH